MPFLLFPWRLDVVVVAGPATSNPFSVGRRGPPGPSIGEPRREPPASRVAPRAVHSGMPIPTPSADLRVGILGYGLAGQAFHAPFIATTPGLRLAMVVTTDQARGEQARRDYPGVQVVRDAAALWEPGAIDLCVITTPNRLHVPLAMAAIERGIACVVDKPFAPHGAEARALVYEARARRVLLTVFQNRRWDGDYLTLRRLVADGALGQVHRFESRFERWRPVPKGGWREVGTQGEAGGLLYDLGSHLIDQALVLFGPARTVYAELDRRRDGILVDDDSFVAIGHASGVRSHLWMSAVAANQGPRFRVLGSRGAWVKEGMDVQEAALRDGAVPGGPGWGVEPEAQWGALHEGSDRLRMVRTEPGHYGAFYAGVARALREGAPPPVEPMDAVDVLYVIEAALQSARDRTVVGLH